MPRPSNNDIEQDKLVRFDRIKKAIVQLEKQQKLFLKQGELAPLIGVGSTLSGTAKYQEILVL